MMGTLELLLLAVGLSMDAFAVSVCKGLAMGRPTWRQSAVPGLWFGGFQGLMPCVGWLLGARFSAYITAVDHWIAFGLLTVIGLSMIREAGQKEELSDDLSFKAMLPLAVATSIDALAVGVTFAFLEVDLLPAAGTIAAVTFCLSALGVKVGGRFGEKLESKAQILGGCILVLLGVKILLEHTGHLPF